MDSLFLSDFGWGFFLFFFINSLGKSLSEKWTVLHCINVFEIKGAQKEGIRKF